jgi:hypothetical protein
VAGDRLATLVGGGYLLTGIWQARSGWGARGLSVFAGLGLIAFETSGGAFTAVQVIGRIAVFPVVGVLGTWLLHAVPASAHTSNPEAAGVDVHI